MLSYFEQDRVLHNLVDQLKRNVDNVPLEQLQTRYRKAYTALVNGIWEVGDPLVEQTLEFCLTLPVKEDLHDTPTLLNHLDLIKREERKPGGLYDQMRAALVDRQDVGEYYELIAKLWERLYSEAYQPYLTRHCHWTGKPGNRWIYNEIADAWWLQAKGDDPDNGKWIKNDYTWAGFPSYPPKLGPDKQKEERTK